MIRATSGNIFYLLKSLSEGPDLRKQPNGISETQSAAIESGLVVMVELEGLMVFALTELGWKIFRVWKEFKNV